MGILHLKLKNYLLAELQFKKALSAIKDYLYYIKTSGTYSKNFIDDLNNINVGAIKFNIGLCLFYQKKYYEAFQVFSVLRTQKDFQTNYYLFYRIGLCLLELELERNNKNNNDYNDLMSNVSNNKRKRANDFFSIETGDDSFKELEKDNKALRKSQGTRNTSNSANTNNKDDDYDDLFVQFENYSFYKAKDNGNCKTNS
mgnify:CR=1 FL=1